MPKCCSTCGLRLLCKLWKGHFKQQRQSTRAIACAGALRLRHLRPDLIAQIHPHLNQGLEPDKLFAKTCRSIVWRCTQCPCGHEHVWTTDVYQRRANNTGCPVCAGHKPCVCNSLQAKLPEMARQWHPTHNQNLLPEHILPNSSRKVQQFATALLHLCCSDSLDMSDMAGKKQAVFPACDLVVSSNDDLVTLSVSPTATYQYQCCKQPQSFGWPAQPLRSATAGWLYMQVWWECEAHGPWQASPNSRRGGRCGCPKCGLESAVRTKLQRRDSKRKLGTLAAGMPELAAQWHPHLNAALTPHDVTLGSERKVWWICRGSKYAPECCMKLAVEETL